MLYYKLNSKNISQIRADLAVIIGEAYKIQLNSDLCFLDTLYLIFTISVITGIVLQGN